MADQLPPDLIPKLLSIIEGKCPACNGNYIHSATVMGVPGVACAACPWGVSYRQLRDDAAPALTQGKPIRPQDIGSAKWKDIPVAVFDAFNAEIAAHFVNGEAVVNQSTVVERIVSSGISVNKIFSKGYLNVEAAYEAAGWRVRYEKPDFNESGPALFYFRQAKCRD